MSAPDRPRGGVTQANFEAHRSAQHTDALADAQPIAQPFRFPVRVYYEDTDAAGVVYYANYLKFMERARTEWLAAIGFPLAAFEREHGVVFVVYRCEIDFLRPARLNDTLEVTVEVADRGAARLVLRQNVMRAKELLTAARVALACVAAQTMRPARIPSALAQRLEIPA